MINAFVISATVYFCFLGSIWTRNGWFNMSLKMAFWGGTLWGAYLIVNMKMFG